MFEEFLKKNRVSLDLTHLAVGKEVWNRKPEWQFSAQVYAQTQGCMLRLKLPPLHTHKCGTAKSQTGGMSRNYLLLLTNFCPWLMMPSTANTSLLSAKHYFVLHYIRQPLLNANLKWHWLHITCFAGTWQEVEGRCQSCQLLSWHWADPDTAADNIISSLPAIPGMSCLANLAVSFCFLAWTRPIMRSRAGVWGMTSLPWGGST